MVSIARPTRRSNINGFTIMMEITDANALDVCIEESDQSPRFIFKHSPSCGISFHAKGQVEAMLPVLDSLSISCRLIDVIHQRDLSQETARRLGVSHQSPQLILVRDGEAVWKASHGAISRKAIERVVQDFSAT
jgi:bacillithiol system protein YtxJ